MTRHMILVATVGCALEAAPAEEAARPFQVWTASSAVKVFRDTAPAVPVPPVRLFAARREHEAVQIVVRAGEKPLQKVLASVSSWQGPGGAADLPTTLYRVGYVHLPAQKADFPDPLPPWSATDIPAESNQPVWLDVAVPPEAQPGEYKAAVRVQPEGMEPATVPLTLTVWNFTLPETPHLRTALGISGNFVAKAHGIEPSGPEYEALLAKYYKALLERRLSAYSPPMDATLPEARKYLADPRCTGYMIPYSEDEASLRRNVETLRKEGLLDKGYFYVVDEPVNKESYERLKTVCRKIRAVDPKLKIVAPYFRNCDFDSKSDIYALLTGFINVWCYNTGFYNGYPQEKQLTERRATGEEAWSYVCCGPGKPFTNFFVEMDALAHRLLFWQQRLHHCSGFLYWSTTYWNPAITKDPWTDMATVKDINPNIYGDGSLFYPGAKVGVDGPVTSVRLENAREGLEDIEYLWLYEQKKGPEAVEAVIRQVTTAWNQFSVNPADVEKARQSLAAGISGSP